MSLKQLKGCLESGSFKFNNFGAELNFMFRISRYGNYQFLVGVWLDKLVEKTGIAQRFASEWQGGWNLIR